MWDCLENGTADCGRSTSFHYTEKFDGTRSAAGKVTSIDEAVAAVRWGQDKLEIEYDAPNVCFKRRFYDLDVDWHNPSPMGNSRKNQLRDHFETTLHASQPWGTNATWCP